MAKKHSRHSPSSAARWMHCPGSIAAEEGLPDESSEPAREGTLAHYVLLERCLPFEIEPEYFIGFKMVIEGFEHEFTEEMAESLTPLYDMILSIPGEHFYENRVSLERWIPDTGGTADIGIVGDDFVMIRDLKFGQGVPVHPEYNEQGLCYMLGLIDMLEKRGFDLNGRRLVIAIDQPRCPGGGGEWEVSPAELRAFAKRLRQAYEATTYDDAPRVPGPKTCEWCKAANTCRALGEFNLAIARQTFDDLDEEPELPDPMRMTPEERAKVLKHEKMFKDWLKAIHFETLKDALAGRDTGGFKAVYGRSPHRRWRNADKAHSDLRSLGIDPFVEPKIISPAEAEKRAKRLHPGRTKEIRELRNAAVAKALEESEDGQAKAILVPDTDPRDAIIGIDAEFEDLDEADDNY